MAELSMTYWWGVWILMGTAFIVAWLFIVRGCEVMDRLTMNSEYQDPDANRAH